MNGSKVVLCCLVALAGCGGHSADGPSSLCADLTQQATDFVAAHQSCSVDADCTGEPAFGFIYEMGSDVSCWPQVVISTDAASGFLSLMNQMSAAQCTGPTRVCSASVPTPACHQGVCGTK
jgi:hypothetical protein